MSFLPPLPDTSLASTDKTLALRYEDLCQDGRMTTIAMPHALVHAWRQVSQQVPLTDLRNAGVLPILSNLWIEGSDEPVLLTEACRSRGHAALAHTRNAEGAVHRLLLDIHIQIFGTRGRMFGPVPEGAGEEVYVGGVYARHVFTRPFAAPGQRAVQSFSHAELAPIPEANASWIDFDEMLGLEENVDDAELLPDAEQALVFGLHHCDSNQHVNSLVYARLFEDAAQRALIEARPDTRCLSRQVAIAYRKPFFAGQSARICLQSWVGEQDLAARGSFDLLSAHDEHEMSSSGTPYAQLAMRFR